MKKPGRFRSSIRAALTTAAILLPAVAFGATAQPVSAATNGAWSVSKAGSAGFVSEALGADTGVQSPEFATGIGNDSAAIAQPTNLVNRSHSASGGAAGQTVDGGDGSVAATNPELGLSFDGLNHRQNRLASHGNQFSLEPPDQGICANGQYVLETVNDVMRVFDTAGNPLTAPTALNAFYGYAPAIVRTPRVYGPFVTDPSCFYDAPSQRWFHVVLTIDVNPANGHFLGSNHLDVAVSKTSNPMTPNGWNIYRIAAQDDGSQGTPDHHCTTNGPGTPDGPCIGDYPHIGADANGFYITTNEYSFFGPEFHGAQIYAISKAALAAGSPVITVKQIDTNGMDAGNSGFTLAPATTPTSAGGSTVYETRARGTEYFLSSNAADEAHGDGVAIGPRTSTQLLTWALTNTSSLNSATPALALTHSVAEVGRYSFPPASEQKAGPHPLGQCLNSDPCATNFVLGAPDPFKESEVSLDSSDTRMLQTTFAGGLLYGALDTGLSHASPKKAGVEYFITRPSVSATGGVSSNTVRNAYGSLPGDNLIYPAIGVTSSGHAVMAFTVVGSNRFPSAGYALLDAENGLGDVHIAAEGLGPDDGFSGYKVFGNRPRWGDYGASAVVGDKVWIASEYINQTCDLDTYLNTGGSCGETRTVLANWGTRVSQVTP